MDKSEHIMRLKGFPRPPLDPDASAALDADGRERSIVAPMPGIVRGIKNMLWDAGERMLSVFQASHEIEPGRLPASVQMMIEKMEAQYDDFDGIGLYQKGGCRSYTPLSEKEAIERYLVFGHVKARDKQTFSRNLDVNTVGGEVADYTIGVENYTETQLPLETAKRNGPLATAVRNAVAAALPGSQNSLDLSVESASEVQSERKSIQGHAILSQPVTVPRGVLRFKSDTVFFELPADGNGVPKLFWKKLGASWYAGKNANS